MTRPRNIKLVIAFDGTRYAGWQKQKNEPTIQGLLEEAITKMTATSVVVHGAGRTDAGVHALGMVANFATGANIPCPGFLKGLNSMLPADIRILAVKDTGPEFHARRSACAKTYFYNICTALVQIPTERLYSAHVPGYLDIEAVKDSLVCLQGSHDFSSFEASGSRDLGNTVGRGANREILAARIIQRKTEDRIRLIFTGDGFLRHMVRNIVGTLIQVGRGKITVQDFAQILAARDRTSAGPTAPAHGLFLQEVHYRPMCVVPEP